MKRTFYITMATFICLFLCSCDMSLSNGDLVGRWTQVSIESRIDSGEPELTNEPVLWTFNDDMTYTIDDEEQTETGQWDMGDSILTLTIVNEGDTLQATLSPEFTLGFQNKSPQYEVDTVSYSLIECIPAGIASGWEKLCNYVNDLKYLFTSQGAKSVSGVIGITNIFPETWDWLRFWNLTALLSIALGVMNVLPIPALDGGHAVFAIYEIITRRKPSDKVLERAQYVGFTILILLLIFATWNDITRLLGL